MQKETKITIRLKSGEDDELIAWLKAIDSSYGKKGPEIKAALRRGIGNPGAAPAAQLDAGNLLADIRQVLEATLSTQLANLSLRANAPGLDTEEDEYANACLDQLGDALLFDVDDEDDQGWGNV